MPDSSTTSLITRKSYKQYLQQFRSVNRKWRSHTSLETQNQQGCSDTKWMVWCGVENFTHCFSDLQHLSADHPELLTSRTLAVMLLHPHLFPLDRMFMKDTIFPPSLVFTSRKLKRLLFHADALHLKWTHTLKTSLRFVPLISGMLFWTFF